MHFLPSTRLPNNHGDGGTGDDVVRDAFRRLRRAAEADAAANP